MVWTEAVLTIYMISVAGHGPSHQFRNGLATRDYLDNPQPLEKAWPNQRRVVMQVCLVAILSRPCLLESLVMMLLMLGSWN